MPASADTPSPLSVAVLGDAVALVQRTFGRVPEDSLVLIGLGGGTTLGHLRVDLAPPVNLGVSAVEQLAGWMTSDEDKRPEAVVVVVCDQQQRYSTEEVDRLSDTLEEVFEHQEIFIAAEHRLTDGHSWREALAGSLQRHPELEVPAAADPVAEAQAWVGRDRQPVAYPDKDSVDPLLTEVVELVVDAEVPDWQAITDLEARLDEAFPGCAAEPAALVTVGKALIAHSKGLGSLAGAFHDRIDPAVTSPAIDYLGRVAQQVHRFAATQATSHAFWRNAQS